MQGILLVIFAAVASVDGRGRYTGPRFIDLGITGVLRPINAGYNRDTFDMLNSFDRLTSTSLRGPSTLTRTSLLRGPSTRTSLLRGPSIVSSGFSSRGLTAGLRSLDPIHRGSVTEIRRSFGSIPGGIRTYRDIGIYSGGPDRLYVGSDGPDVGGSGGPYVGSDGPYITGPYRADGGGSDGPYVGSDGPYITGPYRADGGGSDGPYVGSDGPYITGPYRADGGGSDGPYVGSDGPYIAGPYRADGGGSDEPYVGAPGSDFGQVRETYFGPTEAPYSEPFGPYTDTDSPYDGLSNSLNSNSFTTVRTSRLTYPTTHLTRRSRIGIDPFARMRIGGSELRRTTGSGALSGVASGGFADGLASGGLASGGFDFGDSSAASSGDFFKSTKYSLKDPKLELNF